MPCHVVRNGEYRRGRAHQRAKALETPRFSRPLSDKRKFIVTAAQNNTPVNAEFFAALQTATRVMGAELVVIPYRYKNPTSQREADARLTWDSTLTPYLYNQRKRLNPNLQLAAEYKINPTAGEPLSGLDAITGSDSCIVGHPKLQFKTVPVPSGKFPKILTTTGTCTAPNYSDTKAGAVGKFHYTLGACLVEIDGPLFHLRQLLGDKRDGSFIDLDKRYSRSGVAPAPPAEALILGDTHVRVMDPDCDAATFGAGGMTSVLKPKRLVFHDIFDGETVNPHDAGDPFITNAKRQAGRQDVRAELQQVVQFLNDRAGNREVVLVHSNHHDFLRRWIVRTDWRQDSKNAALYLETALHMLQSARMAPGGAEYADPFVYWMGKLGAKQRIKCLGPNESYRVLDIECGMHGHNGPNGSRGTVKNLARLGVKAATGHGHAPAIEEGHTRTGTSSMRRLAYQQGASSHLNTHVAIYANGKRTLLTTIGTKWRAP